MHPRSWMIVVLPLAATAAGLAIVVGSFVVWMHLEVSAHERAAAPCRAAAAELNRALEEVVPISDWIAAGLPHGGPESRYFLPHGFWKDASSHKSTRFDGKGFQDLTIATPEVAQQRVRDWRKAALTVASGGPNESRSWYLLAKNYSDSILQEPVGLVLHDGVWLEFSLGESLTREQAASFEWLMKSSADRLALVCEAELRPYVEQVRGRARAPR